MPPKPTQLPENLATPTRYVTSRKPARVPAEDGAAKLRWATPHMRLWLSSLQDDYMTARPKHVFVSSRILDFLVLFPDALPGVDFSGKESWTDSDIEAHLGPNQRLLFALWLKRLTDWWSNASRVHRVGSGSSAGVIKMFKTLCATPKRRTRLNGYAELYADEVRNETNAAFDNWTPSEKWPKKPNRMTFNQAYISSLLSSDTARPAHLQGAAWLARLEELDNFVKNGVRVNDDAPVVDDANQAYQQSIDLLINQAQGLIDALGQSTGWNLTLLMGSPMPRNGGEIVTFDIHSNGDPKYEWKHHYRCPEKSTGTLAENVYGGFATWCKSIFNPEVRASRALKHATDAMAGEDVTDGEDITAGKDDVAGQDDIAGTTQDDPTNEEDAEEVPPPRKRKRTDKPTAPRASGKPVPSRSHAPSSLQDDSIQATGPFQAPSPPTTLVSTSARLSPMLNPTGLSTPPPSHLELSLPVDDPSPLIDSATAVPQDPTFAMNPDWIANALGEIGDISDFGDFGDLSLLQFAPPVAVDPNQLTNVPIAGMYGAATPSKSYIDPNMCSPGSMTPASAKINLQRMSAYPVNFHHPVPMAIPSPIPEPSYSYHASMASTPDPDYYQTSTRASAVFEAPSPASSVAPPSSSAASTPAPYSIDSPMTYGGIPSPFPTPLLMDITGSACPTGPRHPKALKGSRPTLATLPERYKENDGPTYSWMRHTQFWRVSVTPRLAPDVQSTWVALLDCVEVLAASVRWITIPLVVPANVCSGLQKQYNGMDVSTGHEPWMPTQLNTGAVGNQWTKYWTFLMNTYGGGVILRSTDDVMTMVMLFLSWWAVFERANRMDKKKRIVTDHGSQAAIQAALEFFSQEDVLSAPATGAK